MRSARAVSTKLVRAGRPLSAKDLRRADRLSRHHSSSLAICCRRRLRRSGFNPFVDRPRTVDNHPRDAGDLVRQRDDDLVDVHPTLQLIEPYSETILGSVEVQKA